jgi:hypothetical protein
MYARVVRNVASKAIRPAVVISGVRSVSMVAVRLMPAVATLPKFVNLRSFGDDGRLTHADVRVI